MDDLVFASAQALAAAIRERRVSSVEVVDAHVAQVVRANPQLNVIVLLDEERARARKKPTQPWRGGRCGVPCMASR